MLDIFSNFIDTTLRHRMLHDHLLRQLDFLRRSCDLYDDGQDDEAIRIAVTLRVLFRDTKSSESLFKLLNQKEKILLMSTFEKIEDIPELNNIIIKDYLPIMLTSEGRFPFLGNVQKIEFLTIDQWLNQIVIIIDGQNLSREEVILTAANKDGGAHIEKRLNQKVKLLKKSKGSFTIKENNREITSEIDNDHFVLLRQFAYEVLNSQSIFELNTIKFESVPDRLLTYRDYVNKGFDFEKEKRYSKALESYKQAIKLKPNNSELAFSNMGNVYAKLEEYEDAKKCFYKAIDINPNFIDALFNLSVQYVQEKRYDKSFELYEKILIIDEKHQKTLHNYGVLKSRLRDLEDEQTYQLEHVYSKSRHINYLHYLGYGLLYKKKYQDAIKVFKKILELDNNDVLALSNLGFIYFKINKELKAKELFDKLINMEVSQIEVCINILEYQLIYNKQPDDAKSTKYRKYFLKDATSLMYLDMFDILFKSNGTSLPTKEIEVFRQEYSHLLLDYDFHDIKMNVDQDIHPILHKAIDFFTTLKDV